MRTEANDLKNMELRILQLICKGYTFKQIGPAVGLSSRTAEAYATNARIKLGAKNNPEMVYNAIVKKIIIPETI